MTNGTYEGKQEPHQLENCTPLSIKKKSIKNWPKKYVFFLSEIQLVTSYDVHVQENNLVTG